MSELAGILVCKGGDGMSRRKPKRYADPALRNALLAVAAVGALTYGRRPLFAGVMKLAEVWDTSISPALISLLFGG